MAIAGGFVVPHPPIIFPEIGHGEELKIQQTIDAYKEAAKRIALIQPETIVIVSPHTVMYKDYFHISPAEHASGDFAQFGFPEIKMEADYDSAFAREIEREAQKNGIHAGMEGELSKELDHGTMIPLRFIREADTRNFKIVRIGISGFSLSEHFHLGKCIRKAAERLNRRTVIVASSDLSHRLLDRGPYEYAKEGPEYDKRITDILSKGDLVKTIDFPEEFCERAGECGHRSITMMAGCLENIPLQSELLSYEGPFGVGYAVASYQDSYVYLARKSLEHSIRTNQRLPMPKELPDEMTKKKAGVFVSLEKFGDLRGCIGTIQGVQSNVAEEVIENAVSAGIWDPRFPQVDISELPDIICTVDVLEEAERVSSISQLDVKEYGVIVTHGRQRGLLLPNLEGVDTVEEQIDIALRKAGIQEEDYRNGNCILERFKVVRHY